MRSLHKHRFLLVFGLLTILHSCYKGDTLEIPISVPYVEANDTLSVPYTTIVYDTTVVRTDRDLTPIIANWEDPYRGRLKAVFHFELQPVSEEPPMWSPVDSAFLEFVPSRQFASNKPCFNVRLYRTEQLPSVFYSNTSVQKVEVRDVVMCEEAGKWKLPFPLAWAQELVDAHSTGIIKSVSEFRQNFGGLAIEVLDTNLVLEVGIGLLNSSQLTIYWSKDTMQGENNWIIPIGSRYGAQYEYSFTNSRLEQWVQGPADSLLYVSPMGSMILVRLPEVPDSFVILGAWLVVNAKHSPETPDRLTVLGYDTTSDETFVLVEALNGGVEISVSRVVKGDTAQFLIPIPLTIQYVQKGTLRAPFVVIKHPDAGVTFSRMLIDTSNVKVYLYIEKSL